MHVLVFANEPPQQVGNLSKDRIKILDLDWLRQINPRYFLPGPLPKWPVQPLISQLWANDFSHGAKPTQLESHVKNIW